jgi:hypothetical protein
MGMLLSSAVAISACSAGQVNQTSSQLRDKTGPQAAVGDLLLREVELAYPANGAYAAGDDAELRAAIVNTGDQPDVLTSVTGPDFTGFRVTGSPTGSAPTGSAVATSTLSPPVTTPTPITPTPSAGATTTPSPGATTTAPSAATPTPAPASTTGAARQVQIQPGDTLFLGENGPTVTLVDLTRPLTAAQVLPVTFTFQRAGQVTIDAIVGTPSQALPRGDAYQFEPPTEGNVPNNEAGGGGIPEQRESGAAASPGATTPAAPTITTSSAPEGNDVPASTSPGNG